MPTVAPSSAYPHAVTVRVAGARCPTPARTNRAPGTPASKILCRLSAGSARVTKRWHPAEAREEHERGEHQRDEIVMLIAVVKAHRPPVGVQHSHQRAHPARGVAEHAHHGEQADGEHDTDVNPGLGSGSRLSSQRKSPRRSRRRRTCRRVALAPSNVEGQEAPHHLHRGDTDGWPRSVRPVAIPCDRHADGQRLVSRHHRRQHARGRHPAATAPRLKTSIMIR